MFLHWDLIDVSPTIRLGFWVWVRKTSEIAWYWCVITSFQGSYYQHTYSVDINHDHLAEVVSFRCIRCKVTPSPHSDCTFRKEVTVHSPHLRGRKSCSTSVGDVYLHTWFRILQHGRILPSRIYLVAYLYQYLTHGYTIQ